MSDPYDTLARDYDWLFPDEALETGAAITQPATARLLDGLDPGASVLDAACGTGIDAAVLARRGFSVWADDKSPAMVDMARQRFEKRGLEIPVFQAEWRKLPYVIDERFDVVLCIGNALVHTGSREAMAEALRGLRGALRPGGRLVVDSRNWEKLHAERPSTEVVERAWLRDGRRCTVVYEWSIPNRFEDEHVANLVFVFWGEDSGVNRHHRVPFNPFTHQRLRDRLQEAGLRVVDDFCPEADRYSIVVA